jgi:D-3-phosphoglycerate dehydrogenase
MAKVLITTVPFAVIDRSPLDQLDKAGIEYVINPIGRRLKEDELAEMAGDFDVLIAGTEPITDRVIKSAKRLKLISRVGIGLDSVDLLAAERHGVQVSYTPDAPAPAVAELALGLMFALMRSTHIASAEMHRGEWKRHFGRRMCDVTVGIIGAGRIGGRVLTYLSKLGFKQLLVNDTNPHLGLGEDVKIERVDKEEIYRESDLLTLHLPLNFETKNLIGRTQLMQMKSDAMVINTSRGGIVNESDLAEVLVSGHLNGAAVDVFEQEPYRGPLANIDRCLLTAHMGSMSIDCRTRMEIEATQEAIRFLKGEPLQGLVPKVEFDIQRQGL